MTNVILSFYSTKIEESDISILDRQEWLNDRLIRFFFQYLEKVKYKHYDKSVCFVAPEVCQCIKLTHGPAVRVFVEPHNLQNKDFVMLAVNDREDKVVAGDSHWSLLVYVRHYNSFYHFDSSGSANLQHASSMMKHLIPFMKCQSAPFLINAFCLQQCNDVDCGIHMICNAEFVCAKHFEHFQGGAMEYVTNQLVAGKRQWLKKLILSFR